MQRPSATPFLATLAAGTDLAVAALAVELPAAGDRAPEWIKIAPRGELRCRDGRIFQFDPDAVAARFAADGTDVPVDIGHATVKDDAAPAVAWLKAVEPRADGLWGKPDWLAPGLAVLKAKSHRYVSPAFHHDAHGHATWLHSVALVAAPALSNMPALASAQMSHPEPPMKSVIAALGLSESANEAACLSALNENFVPKKTHADLLAQLSTATGELAAIKKASHDADVTRVLEDALTKKKMLPAQRDGFAKMAATPEGLANVKSILDATAEGAFAAASTLEGRRVPADGADTRDAATLAAEATKVAKERNCSIADAMAIVTAAKPAA